MPEITIYTTRWCGYCVRAKALLDSRGLSYEEVNLDDDPHFRQRLFDLTGGWTVPLVGLVVLVVPQLLAGLSVARPSYIEDAIVR